MTSLRRYDATGRSSAKLVSKVRKLNAPPDSFIWQTREMLESPAFRAAPINTRRFLDRLGIDHISHAGTMNGQLKATYGQLVEYGIHREEIPAAIEVAIALGFVRRTSVRRLRVATTYRVTWIGHFRDDNTLEPATNEWRKHSHATAREAVRQVRARLRSKRSKKTGVRKAVPDQGNLERESVPESRNVPFENG